MRFLCVIAPRERSTIYMYLKVGLFMLLIIKTVISVMYVYGYDNQNANEYVKYILKIPPL